MTISSVINTPVYLSLADKIMPKLMDQIILSTLDWLPLLYNIRGLHARTIKSKQKLAYANIENYIVYNGLDEMMLKRYSWRKDQILSPRWWINWFDVEYRMRIQIYRINDSHLFVHLCVCVCAKDNNARWAAYNVQVLLEANGERYRKAQTSWREQLKRNGDKKGHIKCCATAAVTDAVSYSL